MRVNTRDQIWKLPDIVEHFSRYIPIEPGDMFSTGAPGGVAVGKPNAAELFLKPGDVVECAHRGHRDAAHHDRRAAAREVALAVAEPAASHWPCAASLVVASSLAAARCRAARAGLAAAQAFPAEAGDDHRAVPARRRRRHAGAHRSRRSSSAIWGQTVVIENKPGASGHIGAELVANRPPTATRC